MLYISRGHEGTLLAQKKLFLYALQRDVLVKGGKRE